MKTIVIIGGGIAGTTCVEYVSTLSANDVKIILIAANDVVKTAVTTRRVTNIIEEIAVDERNYRPFENQFSNVSVVTGLVNEIHTTEKLVKMSNSEEICYDKLCICTGAKPKTILSSSPHVVCIRDTDTVKCLQNKLSKAKKLIVIGNGGIALELIHEIENCHVTWCIKSDHIGNSFFNEGASAFLLGSFTKKGKEEKKTKKSEQTIFTRRVYETEREFLKGDTGISTSTVGSALGPSWSKYQNLSGSLQSGEKSKTIIIKTESEPKRIFSSEQGYTDENIYVELCTGEILGADLIICATGVVPNFPIKVVGTEIKTSPDGGIYVDCNMKTNDKDIYAAGDICTPNWEYSEHWFPMKLWTQGWQMGAHAGKCIVENLKGTDLDLDFCFELFTHATTFFGYKVCLLGCYNYQNINKTDCHLLIRHTPNKEYIELVVMNGRVQGATLIGETDLEETFENLIINQIDISFLGEGLLDPNVDIEDYFD